MAKRDPEGCSVFVTVKSEPTKDDPTSNQCWCHGAEDKDEVGTPRISVVSRDAETVLEFCPLFFGEMLAQSIGLHIGALKKKIKDWPLVDAEIIKGTE